MTISRMTESFRCPLCASECYRVVRVLTDRIARTTDRRFTLARCANCGLLRLHPQPDGDILDAAYPDDYAPFNRPGLSGRIKRLLERKGIGDIWAYLQPPRPILDVGCAGGELLDLIRRAGNPDVHGLEPDSYAVDLARKRGIPVTEGYLEEAGFPDERFSTVLLDHVLEHVVDPDVFMAEARRILIGGGAVVIWLPNADSYAARVLGSYWMGYDAPRHLTTFSLDTLSKLLEKHRFRIVRVHHERSGLEWAWGLRLWLRERIPAAEKFLRRFHVAAILLATPLGILAARRKQSGRVRVIAVKVPDPDTANIVELYRPTG
ncbi:class I SAM-dependent methyltransferase [soil metagenome]